MVIWCQSLSVGLMGKQLPGNAKTLAKARVLTLIVTSCRLMTQSIASGGGGNRTRVLMSFGKSLYVHSLLIGSRFAWLSRQGLTQPVHNFVSHQA